MKDLAPISQLASLQFAIVSGPKSQVGSISEMRAKSKSDPSTATFGSSGNGTVPHFLGMMLAEGAGIALTHVPYQGGAPAMNALLGGHIGYNVDVVLESLEHHRAGKVRVIAVAGAQRSAQFPDVPTLREQGVAMDASAWFAMYGPGALPSAQVQRLSTAVQAASRRRLCMPTWPRRAWKCSARRKAQPCRVAWRAFATLQCARIRMDSTT